MHIRNEVTIMNPVGFMSLEEKEDHWHDQRTRQKAKDVVNTLTQGFEYVYFFQAMKVLAREMFTGENLW